MSSLMSVFATIKNIKIEPMTFFLISPYLECFPADLTLLFGKVKRTQYGRGSHQVS